MRLIGRTSNCILPANKSWRPNTELTLGPAKHPRQVRANFTPGAMLVFALGATDPAELNLFLAYKLSGVLRREHPHLWLEISHRCHRNG